MKANFVCYLILWFYLLWIHLVPM